VVADHETDVDVNCSNETLADRIRSRSLGRSPDDPQALGLEDLVTRRSTETDKRVTKIEISPEGAALARRIDEDVHVHMEYFSRNSVDH
jgi:hypothetical protein